jgi:hypothetical protein
MRKFILATVVFLSVVSCHGGSSEIVITCKTKDDPPYRFAFYSNGLAIFSRHEIRIVAPETAFAHPHDYNAYLNQRYGKILVDSFDVGRSKFNTIAAFVSKVGDKMNQEMPVESFGIFFEARGTPEDSLRYAGKVGDAPVFSDLICIIFNDTDQSTPAGMLPYFKEKFGVRCKPK